ncbi:TIR domain-containing protein [Cytophagaceae bacterium DM2B3-1]|uniref:TIR domain-containing protein n=1 Tax=Xanthocytophaga flava TaxID=3048013 RepID=A0ABT7CZS3_9BACT|nr:TIR domain-containing protein [Xanthocytophaga flavus]MDJ1498412.1 TIR domain-containing protein [Xanthocytophaga flavus]
MARKVFFSFHFKRDSQRVSQIRNCNAVSNHFEQTPFLDWAEWEKIERTGSTAIKRWIDNNMHGSGVVVLCFGLETHTREWVIYELEKAHKEGRGIVAIDMSGMKDLQGNIDKKGKNPLLVATDIKGTELFYYAKYKTYHWIDDDGRNNIDDWIEDAAVAAGR